MSTMDEDQLPAGGHIASGGSEGGGSAVGGLGRPRSAASNRSGAGSARPGSARSSRSSRSGSAKDLKKSVHNDAEKKYSKGVLEVLVVGGKNLHPEDTSDNYVVGAFTRVTVNGQVLGQTEVQRQNDPEWHGDSFVEHLKLHDNVMLKLEVFDEDPLGAGDALLSTITISVPCVDFIDKELLWYQLKTFEKIVPYSIGKAYVQPLAPYLALTRYIGSPDELEIDGDDGKPAQQVCVIISFSPIEDRRRMDDSDQSEDDEDFSLDLGMDGLDLGEPHGAVAIDVIAGANIKDQTPGSQNKCESYVVGSIGKEKFRSSVHEKAFHPEYNTRMTFNECHTAQMLVVTIMDRDMVADSALGSVVFPLDRLEDGRMYEGWYPLKRLPKRRDPLADAMEEAHHKRSCVKLRFQFVSSAMRDALVRENGPLLFDAPSDDEEEFDVGGIFKRKVQIKRETKSGPYEYSLASEFTGGYYEGDYVNGRMEGNGVFHFPNGTIYRGQFKDNMFHGDGTLEFKGLGKYRSTWNNGVKVEGDYTFSDGLQYTDAWDYATLEKDRRFYTEKLHGVKPSGSSQFMNRHPAPPVPKGNYDTADGYFNARLLCVQDYDTDAVIRSVPKGEAEWIEQKCRYEY